MILTSANSPVDFSLITTSGDGEESCVPSVLSGIVQDLLDNTEDTDNNKILNALDFPLWNGNCNRNAYSTDLAAWDVTRGLHIFDPSALYPTGDVRWGLAGLKHSMTFLHIDPDRFHTENTVGVGGKAWGLLRERPGIKKSSIDFYLNEAFCLNDVVETTDYDFEVIALRLGDRMCVLWFSLTFIICSSFFLVICSPTPLILCWAWRTLFVMAVTSFQV